VAVTGQCPVCVAIIAAWSALIDFIDSTEPNLWNVSLYTFNISLALQKSERSRI